MAGPAVSGRRGPTRSRNAPDQRDSAEMVRIKGSIDAPAAAGEKPWAWIRSNDRKNIVAVSAAYRQNVRRFAPANARERKRSSGSIGCARDRSTTTNRTSIPAPKRRGPRTRRSPNPRPEDSINPNTKPPSPAVTSAAPARSSGCAPAWRDSGTLQTAIATTAAARGTLIQKTARQETAPTSHPPRTGPIAAATAVAPDQVPIARPRSAAGKAEPINARLPGTRSAPP